VDEERDDVIANAKLPAGLEAEGRDEDLETGEFVHPSGSGPHGHTTPPGTALPEEKEDGD
jgi:hypothetical protein